LIAENRGLFLGQRYLSYRLRLFGDPMSEEVKDDIIMKPKSKKLPASAKNQAAVKLLSKLFRSRKRC